MKLNFYGNCLLLAALIFQSAIGFTQQRKVDHEVICVSPAGQMINGKGLPLVFGFQVNGPDPYYGDDSTIYRLFTVSPSGDTVRVFQGLLIGDGTHNEHPIGTRLGYGENYDIVLTFPDLKEPYTLDFCTEVSTFATNSDGSLFQLSTIIDPYLDNNTCCKQLTIVPEPGSSAIAERQNEEGLWVYPNPVKDKLYIRTSAGFAERGMQVFIYDIRGRLLKEQWYTAVGSDEENTLAVDVADIPTGIYHVLLQSTKGTASRKIIINR